MSTETPPSDNAANPYQTPRSKGYASTRYEPPRGRSIFEHIVRPTGKRRVVMAIFNAVSGAMFGALIGFLAGVYNNDVVWAYQGALLGGSVGTILAMLTVPRPGDEVRPRYGTWKRTEESSTAAPVETEGASSAGERG